MLQHGMLICMNVIVTTCFKWPGNHFKQLTHTPISFVYIGSVLELARALYNGECGRLSSGISKQLQIPKKV
jgi:hypothetical protein